MEEKEIELQKKVIQILIDAKIELAPTKPSIEACCSKVQSAISRFYSKESSYEKSIERVKSHLFFIQNSGTSPLGDTYYSLKEQLETIVVGIIREVNDLGLPKQNLGNHQDKSINITNTLSQSQTQKMEMGIFLSTLKDELTGKQYVEIEGILKEEDKANLKERVFDKLKSFGESVLASIIANVITNPTLWPK